MAYELSIRKYQDSDYDQLRQFFGTTWPKTYSSVLGEQVVLSMLADLDTNKMKNMMPGNDEITYLAFENSSLEGTITIAERRSVSYVWGMYVQPEKRRQGVGSTLLHHAMNFLITATSVEVRVLESSPWAISFYQKHGFKKIGTEPFEIAENTTVTSFVMAFANTLTK
jgi:ribosomal protein S18 acetylase RimI-like enzyme